MLRLIGRFWGCAAIFLILVALSARSGPVAPAGAEPLPTYAPVVSTELPQTRSAQALTATPDAVGPDASYNGLSIAELANRAYGGGELTVQRQLGSNAAFTRLLVSYPSDGLTIYGFMNVPNGEGPFPVLIVLHGYVAPNAYNTLTYTTRYADALARAGYVVIHPNLRGYAPSDDGPNRFRVGFAIDTLNLIAIIRAQGGQPGALQKARPEAIGLWGHSMGGGVSIRVLTLSADVRAAVLYGSMSGDEQRNYERVLVWSGGTRGREELQTPAEVLHRISPINALDRIRAAVSIHHGEKDATVPPAWSQDLCARLQTLQKSVECFSYPGQPHTFQGAGDRQFIQRSIAFYDAHLKP